MSGSCSTGTRFFDLPGVFDLETGQSLSGVRVAYRTWGRRRTSATLVCHALTGNADAHDWWAGLFGPGRTLDPDQDFIISSNVLGSCYGTTGPASIQPGTVRPYGGEYPEVSIRDMVRLQAHLLDHLGVTSQRMRTEEDQQNQSNDLLHEAQHSLFSSENVPFP